MGWTCSVCTYRHDDEKAFACSVCHCRRQGPKAVPTTKGKSKSKQLTLFGQVAHPQKQKATRTKSSSAQEVAAKSSDKGKLCFPEFTEYNLPFEALSERAKKILRNVFGFSKLRGMQSKAIECALRRQSQIVVMATGGGKSLCYALPALVVGGLTLVVCPLKALMADQVQGLLKKGIPAAFISSQLTEAAKLNVMERVLQRSLRARSKPADASAWKGKHINLLYCTPELLQTDRFRSCLMELHKARRLTGFAIDEAHCVSQWGHDFRPAFLKLDYLRVTFPELPLMACTATATQRVIEDIQRSLRLSDRPCHIGTFNRMNVFYKVRYRDVLEESPKGATGDMVDFIKKRHKKALDSGEKCNGIVYVHRQKDTIELASIITREAGVRAEGYHGGMKDVDRIRIQEAWTKGDVPIAIATVAFGMGIDLPHVRYVIHWNMAKTVEGFYQESGRAGRDGLPAYSLLYFAKQDVSMFDYLARMKQSKQKDANLHAVAAVEKMVDYCTIPGCRRQFLLRFFGEKNTDPKTVCQKTCDFCQNPEKVRNSIEAASCVNNFSYHVASSEEWNGQWDKAHGDDDDSDNDMDHFYAANRSEGLSLFGDGVEDSVTDEAIEKKPGTKVGFTKASDILAKYEMQENRGNQRDQTNRKRKGTANIPEHMREVLPDPLTRYEPKVAGKSSAALGADSERLVKELEMLKTKRETLALKASRAPDKKAPPPPPPPLEFASKKKRRR